MSYSLHCESKTTQIPNELNEDPKLHFLQIFPFHSAQLASVTSSITLLHYPIELS